MLGKIFDAKSRAVALYQGANLLKGPLILVPVAFFLNDVDQGVWFAFISIGGIITLADLGFTSLLSQFIAHEFSHVDTTSPEKIVCKRSLSFVRASFFFYILIASVATIITFFVGRLLFFDQENLLPWCIYAVGCWCNLIFLYLSSILNGMGFIEDSYRLRAFCSLANGIVAFLMLIAGAGVWALSVSLFLSSAGFALTAFLKNKAFWKNVRRIGNISLRKIASILQPLFAVQARFVVSWVAGYVIFQMPISISFKFVGVEDAGKLGMALTIMMTLVNFSGVFISSKEPVVARASAKLKEYEALEIFTEGLRKRVVTYVLMAIGILVGVFLVKKVGLLTEKLLDPIYFFILGMSYFCLSIFNSWANYSRSHKEEAFMLHSVVNALIVTLSMYMGLILNQSIWDYICLSVIGYLIILLPYGQNIHKGQVKKYLNRVKSGAEN